MARQREADKVALDKLKGLAGLEADQERARLERRIKEADSAHDRDMDQRKLEAQREADRLVAERRVTVNGLPAVYGTARVNNGQSQVDVVVFAYEFARDRAYHFTAIAPAGRAATFNEMFQSMRRITQAEATSVVPKKLQVVTVGRGDTVASLARRMAYDSAQEDRFRVLNALSSGATLTPGQKVKLVVRAR